MTVLIAPSPTPVRVKERPAPTLFTLRPTPEPAPLDWALIARVGDLCRETLGECVLPVAGEPLRLLRQAARRDRAALAYITNCWEGRMLDLEHAELLERRG